MMYAISTMIATQWNSNGGKRPVKDSKEPPLQAHEIYVGMEVMQILFPNWLPESLKNVVRKNTKGKSIPDFSLEVAEGILRAVERDLIEPGIYASYISKIHMDLVSKTEKGNVNG